MRLAYDISPGKLQDLRKMITNTLQFLRNFKENFRQFLVDKAGGKTLKVGSDEQITILEPDVLITIIFERYAEDAKAGQPLLGPQELNEIARDLQRIISKLTQPGNSHEEGGGRRRMGLKLEKWLDVIQKMRLITERETECKFYIQKVRVQG
jgi:hypothetical protein